MIGGLGFTGSVLVSRLLGHGHQVVVFDKAMFGRWIQEKQNLTIIEGDFLEPSLLPDGPFDTLIHLANIANDPGVELMPELSWETNVLGTHALAEWAIGRAIPHFIYASSGSVYGISDAAKVTESHPLVPISTYNKTKMVAERVLMSFREHLNFHIVRPATVCGLSPRMRFDVSVNLLTLQAFQRNEIVVFGGRQVRPNIHVNDLASVYLHLVENPHLEPRVLNAGFENLSILDIAELISAKTGARISVTLSNDPRSYRLDSSRLLGTGFKPSFTVSNAVDEILASLEQGDTVDRPEWHTVEWMKFSAQSTRG